MKIKYAIHEYKPKVQYIARYKDLPMASSDPELTEVKVEKERLDRPGITLVKEKEVKIWVLHLLWLILLGRSLSEIVEKKTGERYTFNHIIEN